MIALKYSMIQGCPNSACISFQQNFFIRKDGHYFRKDDARKIQRFKCTKCYRKFSFSTHTLEYRQKKRRINHPLFKILSSGVSLRRSAIILGVNRKTIERKLLYLAKKSKKLHEELLLKIGTQKITHLQIDDLITSEHTKLKPLSISIAVDARTRMILGATVSQLPAFGRLASLSRRKYGERTSNHKEMLHKLFAQIEKVIAPDVVIKTDEHQNYPDLIKTFFPHSEHRQYKSVRARIAGLGELKKNGRDPIFSINHTCAMFRANINRLFRRTWCTTKKSARLDDHLAIYMAFHNNILLN